MQALPGYSWIVDSSNGGFLARDMGWKEPILTDRQKYTWGWGVAIRVKDYMARQLKTLVIGSNLIQMMNGSDYMKGTLLLR